jgi:hypothetical protein
MDKTAVNSTQRGKENIMDNLKEYFLEKSYNFIDFSNKNNSLAKIRTKYLLLLKEFNPDENNNIDFETAEECKRIIRGVYNKILKEKDRTKAPKGKVSSRRYSYHSTTIGGKKNVYKMIKCRGKTIYVRKKRMDR